MYLIVIFSPDREPLLQKRPDNCSYIHINSHLESTQNYPSIVCKWEGSATSVDGATERTTNGRIFNVPQPDIYCQSGVVNSLLYPQPISAAR